MSTKASQRYAEAMTRLRDLDPDAYRAILARVESYKGINQKLREAQRVRELAEEGNACSQ